MTIENAGSCNCGAVRFRTRGALRDVIFCHCAQCRKQTGHYFAATNVPLDRIDIEGQAAITWFAASDAARRGFCGTCGSALFWKAAGSETISILAGAFDTPAGFRGMRHIFTAEKGDYYAICDGLPQHERS